MCLEKTLFPERDVVVKWTAPWVSGGFSENSRKTLTQGEFDKYWKLFIV
jgi:hypothetical protein